MGVRSVPKRRSQPLEDDRINVEKELWAKIRTDGSFLGAWLSLVERFVRDEEVAGSNPVAPTISRC
jgi:hypothetical protein